MLYRCMQKQVTGQRSPVSSGTGLTCNAVAYRRGQSVPAAHGLCLACGAEHLTLPFT